MDALKELIAEGEIIRSEMVNALNERAQVGMAWPTVVRWHVDGLAYAKEHSSRPYDDEFLDPSSETSRHYEQIDRLLTRLRAIQASKSSS